MQLCTIDACKQERDRGQIILADLVKRRFIMNHLSGRRGMGLAIIWPINKKEMKDGTF